MPIIGTKNLGLIKAIHVGVNPPLNTKILWYNDANTPYTTGPAKVHYYYDVILADWYPLCQNTNPSNGGNFTYIAFAEACSGEGFSLDFNAERHCYWAIITSNTEIDLVDLVPDLFSKKWTIYCRCDENGKTGNFTYLRFSDECGEGDYPIYEEPGYEAPCVDCSWGDSYIVNPLSNGSFSATASPNGGLTVEVVNGLPGQQLIIDTQLNGADLINFINYVVEITTVATYNGRFTVHLGNPGDGENIIGPVTEQRTVHSNVDGVASGSQIIITLGNFEGTMNTTFDVRLGQETCLTYSGEGEVCKKCRCYWAVITSETEITDLSYANFKGMWIPTGACDDCGCSDEDESTDCDCETILKQMEKLFKVINELQEEIRVVEESLTKEIAELREIIDECCAKSASDIKELTALIAELSDKIKELEDRATETEAEDTKWKHEYEQWRAKEILDERAKDIDDKIDNYKETDFVLWEADNVKDRTEQIDRANASTLKVVEETNEKVSSNKVVGEDNAAATEALEIRVAQLEGGGAAAAEAESSDPVA